MKKKILISIVVLLPIAQLLAQNVAGGIQGKGIDMQTSPGGFVKQLPMAPAETKGDVYLNSEWALADITLFNQNAKLAEYPVRVNLQTNDLEINYQNQVKVLSGRSVKHFAIKSNNGSLDKYVNARKYKLNNSPVGGFLKVIDSSKWELLSMTKLKLVKSNYVAALDAGDRSDQLVKEEVFYFSDGINLFPVFHSVKKFTAQFHENGELIKTYIKTNDLSLKSTIDLMKIQVFLSQSL